MNLREKSCDGKKSFAKYKEAERSMRYVIKRTGDGYMTVYRCRYCQDYHFGHDIKKTT